jgi:hypothetical protein
MAIREAGMAVTESGTSVTGGGHPPIRTRRFRGIWLWTTIAALFVAVAAIVVGSLASAYQPLGMWGNLIGCLYGMECGDGMRTVNTFGGQTRAVFIGVPVQTPRCYIPRAWQVLDEFYVKERFGPFTKWVRIPLMQPFLLQAPAGPPNQPASGVVCLSR